MLLGSVVGVVLLGAGLFALAEDLPYTTGLYWAVTTATTVGYGDITPHNPVGRLIASLLMLTAIPLLAGAFAIVSGAAAAAGIRRVLNMRTTFPDGTYRLIVGMSPNGALDPRRTGRRRDPGGARGRRRSRVGALRGARGPRRPDRRGGDRPGPAGLRRAGADHRHQ